MIAAVFAMQGFGILSAAIVSVITLPAFRSSIVTDDPVQNTDNIDYVWRIVLGVGAIPGLIALYFRLTIPETPRYTMDIEANVEQATKDITSVLQTGTYERSSHVIKRTEVEAPKATWTDFWSYFGQWKNGKILLGTAVTWFALDVAFYGLNNTFILEKIGFSKGDPFTTLWHVSVGNIIINLLGTVPGYWFTVFLVDKWGRKSIQLMGFTILTALFLVLGFAFDPIKEKSIPLFVVIFTLIQVIMCILRPSVIIAF